MTTTEAPSVDNGVNVAALLAAREALTAAPEAAQFQWRARCEWVYGTHARTTIEDFSGLGAEQSHRTAFAVDTDHPEIFASEDNAMTPVEMVLAGLAGCLTAGVAAVATNRGVQAARGHGHARGRHGHPGHPRDRPRRAQRLRWDHGHVRDRGRRAASRDRGHRRPVAEALGRLRHRHQPDQRRRHGRLSATSTRLREGADVVDVTAVVVIGAGPAGLAMSRCLRDESIDHVLLERAEVAHSWRHERWDSLRTLTPNWMNRLPGLPYTGDDPDGYMTAAEVADRLVRYGQVIDAPVQTGTTVVGLRPASPGLARRDRPGTVAVSGGGDRHRRHQPTPHSRRRGTAAGRDPATEPDPLPEP